MYTSNSCEWISIHSPRMGRDAELQPARLWPDDFNPLSPHGERLYAISGMGTPLSFQSTLPAWGETRPARPPGLLEHHFNPLSPHGERRAARRWMCLHPDFNPLSPHGERRMLLSRTPTRPEHFNPLSPHGERPKCCTSSCVQTQFQSTLPAWGETLNVCRSELAELFQSTLPAWGETASRQARNGSPSFQSTLPAWGETQPGHPPIGRSGNFNPLSPHGERHASADGINQGG